MHAIIAAHSRLALALALVATSMAVAPALAQTTPPSGAAAATDPLCAAYGPGFTRLAGSKTCVKINASIQTDAAGTDASRTVRTSPLAPALKSQ